MIHEVEPLGTTATLTSYVHNRAPRLSNVDRRPAVLVLPGGSYEHCSDRESEPVAMAMAGSGYHSFVLRYRVGEQSGWPNPLADAEAALQAIIDGADRWGVDTDRIAVIGFSAGGHLALALSVLGRVRPARTMLVYPVVTQATLQVCHPAARTAPDLLDAVDASCPPAFIAHTALDELVPVSDSLQLAERLAQAGVPFELHVFPDGKHGLALGTAFTSNSDPEWIAPTFASWTGLAIDWLRRQFPVD